MFLVCHCRNFCGSDNFDNYWYHISLKICVFSLCDQQLVGSQGTNVQSRGQHIQCERMGHRIGWVTVANAHRIKPPELLAAC